MDIEVRIGYWFWKEEIVREYLRLFKREPVLVVAERPKGWLYKRQSIIIVGTALGNPDVERSEQEKTLKLFLSGCGKTIHLKKSQLTPTPQRDLRLSEVKPKALVD